MPRVEVKQVENAEVPVEIIAQAVVDISVGMKKLLSGTLTEDALVLLIQHAAPNQKKHRHATRVPYPQKTIRAVLQGIASLEKTYIKRV